MQEVYGKNWDPTKITLEQAGADAHLAYWGKQIAEGSVLLAGPWQNFQSAWVVFSDTVTTWAQAIKIAENDPWNKSEQVEAVIQAWETNPLEIEEVGYSRPKKTSQG